MHILFFVGFLWTLQDAIGADSKILYFLKTTQPNLVKIELNEEDQNLPLGGILKSYRSYKGLKIPTGELKILHLEKNQALAEVIKDGNPYAKSLYQDYSGVMAGDGVEKPREVIIANPQVTPILEFYFKDLFIDPSDKPQTYELTAAGKALLSEKIKPLVSLRFHRIIVSGYTDDINSHEENQVESFQRALTIAQFMSQVLGFDHEKVIPLGLGEDDLKDDSMTPGARDRNRRLIVTIEP